MENTFEKKEENKVLMELTNHERNGNALLIQLNHSSIFIQDSPFFKEKKKEYEEMYQVGEKEEEEEEVEEKEEGEEMNRIHELYSKVEILLSSCSYLSLKYIELGLKESKSYTLFHHRFTLFKMEFEYLFNQEEEDGMEREKTLKYLLKNGSFKDKGMVYFYLSKKEKRLEYLIQSKKEFEKVKKNEYYLNQIREGINNLSE
jgi:hypothetical protein